MEFPVATHTRSDYDKRDGSQRIDIVVTDMTSFVEDEDTSKRFKSLTHDIFVEVKWLYKGPRGTAWEMSMAGRASGVARDAVALERHLWKRRCRVAAVLVVDEECFFEDRGVGDFEWPKPPWPSEEEKRGWPSDVIRFVASPRELNRRGL